MQKLNTYIANNNKLSPDVMIYLLKEAIDDIHNDSHKQTLLNKKRELKYDDENEFNENEFNNFATNQSKILEEHIKKTYKLIKEREEKIKSDKEGLLDQFYDLVREIDEKNKIINELEYTNEETGYKIYCLEEEIKDKNNTISELEEILDEKNNKIDLLENEIVLKNDKINEIQRKMEIDRRFNGRFIQMVKGMDLEDISKIKIMNCSICLLYKPSNVMINLCRKNCTSGFCFSCFVTLAPNPHFLKCPICREKYIN